MNDTTEAPQRFLSPAVVRARTSLSRNTIGRLMRAGLFPSAIRLSRRRTGFSEADINLWMAERGPANA